MQRACDAGHMEKATADVCNRRSVYLYRDLKNLLLVNLHICLALGREHGGLEGAVICPVGVNVVLQVATLQAHKGSEAQNRQQVSKHSLHQTVCKDLTE
jgi:hypothetical protein